MQEARETLRSEVDSLLNKISEAENVAEAVRADLSPEIATVQDGIERWGGDEVGKWGGGGEILEGGGEVLIGMHSRNRKTVDPSHPDRGGGAGAGHVVLAKTLAVIVAKRRCKLEKSECCEKKTKVENLHLLSVRSARCCVRSYRGNLVR